MNAKKKKRLFWLLTWMFTSLLFSYLCHEFDLIKNSPINDGAPYVASLVLEAFIIGLLLIALVGLGAVIWATITEDIDDSGYGHYY